MLRRIVSTLLIFALLGYAMSLAITGHARDAADQGSTWVHAQVPPTPDGGICGHCGHAAAHLLGLTTPSPRPAPPVPDCFPPPPDQIATSAVACPPLRPPRA